MRQFLHDLRLKIVTAVKTVKFVVKASFKMLELLALFQALNKARTLLPALV